MNLNVQWGKTLVQQLIEQEVTYFCLAPGFRSTPLAIAIGEESQAQTFVHYDERGLAFHALGYAKASGKPAAIIVTSGTALGNLMPAVMEASSANIPMILLTCDRPHELRDTMANQTTDQIKIFGDFVRHFVDLPAPQEGLPPNFLATTVGRAVAVADGPVQINCPFREPFFDVKPVEAIPSSPTRYITSAPSLDDTQIEEWARRLQEIEKGVIILGAGGGCASAHKLAHKLGWPLFADIISHSRESGAEMSIPYYHHIIKSKPELKADAILHFGDPFVSKTLLEWMKGPIFHVAPHYNRCDPTHQVSERLVSSIENFCSRIEPLLLQKPDSWFQTWKGLSDRIGEILPSILERELCEPLVTKVVEASAVTGALFFGNSMPIRDADMFFFPKAPCGPVFANRGLSGIDGNVATIAGIAQLMPVTAVIGDQTFLHDLNSLPQLAKTRHPVKLIVINNGGGGIFSFVAIGKRKDLLDPYFSAAHDHTFEGVETLFGLPYHKIEKKEELEKPLQIKESAVLEVFTNREKNHLLHKEIDEALATCISFSTAS